MKRFIVLGLVLLVLGVMRCETAVSQEGTKRAIKLKAKEVPTIKFSLEEFRKLKTKLKVFQGKLIAVKKKIQLTPTAKRAPLIKEKLEFKHKCDQVLALIRAYRIRLEKLYTEYYEECLRKATMEKNDAEGKVSVLEFKIKTLKEKLVEICECMKVAPKADIQELK